MCGRIFGCSNCHLEWASGWSHHIGQFLICRSCGTQIAAMRAESFGPRKGERLQLFYAVEAKDKWQATNVYVIVPEVCVGEDGVTTFGYEPSGRIDCPHCRGEKSVTDKLLEGEACPRCKIGVMEERGMCIY